MNMQILQLVGILIIVNSLTSAAWFMAYSKSQSLGVSTLVCFAIVVGLALVFNERASEISFGKIASIKTAAQQATTDAQEIASIRQRVEAQASTLDLVAKASADSKQLLDQLREENIKADEKLKQLVQKTSDIDVLPDGRTRMGTLISGEPSFLKTHFDKLLADYYEAKDFPSAYDEAKKCIKAFEESSNSMESNKTIVIGGGGLTVGGKVNLYGIGAVLATKFKEFDTAVTWAKKIVDLQPTPKNKAFLFARLRYANRNDEANKIMIDLFAQNKNLKTADIEDFFGYLKSVGMFIEKK
jgi:hypothetical protein